MQVVNQWHQGGCCANRRQGRNGRRAGKGRRPHTQRGCWHQVIRAYHCGRYIAPRKTKRWGSRHRCQRTGIRPRGQLCRRRTPRHTGRQAQLLGFHQPRVARRQQLCAPHTISALFGRVGNVRQPLPRQQHVGVAARKFAQAVACARNIARLGARNQFIHIASVRQHAASLTDRARVRQPSAAHRIQPQKSALQQVLGYNAAEYLRSEFSSRHSPARTAAPRT